MSNGFDIIKFSISNYTHEVVAQGISYTCSMYMIKCEKNHYTAALNWCMWGRQEKKVFILNVQDGCKIY